MLIRTTAAPTAAATSPTASNVATVGAVSAKPLANTGANSTALLWIALIATTALGFGGLLMVRARRRVRAISRKPSLT